MSVLVAKQQWQDMPSAAKQHLLIDPALCPGFLQPQLRQGKSSLSHFECWPPKKSRWVEPYRAMIWNETKWHTLTNHHVYQKASWLQPRCPKNRSAANAEAGPPAMNWNKAVTAVTALMLLEQRNRATFRSEAMPGQWGSNRNHHTVVVQILCTQRSKAWSLTNPGAMIHDLWVWIWDMFGLRRVDPFSTFQHHLGSWHFDPSSVILGRDDKNQSLYVAFPGHSLTLFKHVQTICHLLVDSGTTRITIIYYILIFAYWNMFLYV